MDRKGRVKEFKGSRVQRLKEYRTEDRDQRSEVRGQRTEDRDQRTEVRGQKSEDRKQIFFIQKDELR